MRIDLSSVNMSFKATSTDDASAANERTTTTKPVSLEKPPLPDRNGAARRATNAEIYQQRLPIQIHPLPAFIPHNPLSLLHVVYVFLSQTLRPPSSHPVIHKAYFSLETQSVHVTDPGSIRALWEQGFFGKGSLSRSEPRWLDGERRRLGLVARLTSEEVTRKRREERKHFKLERARKEREAIEQQLREEGKLNDRLSGDSNVDGRTLADLEASSDGIGQGETSLTSDAQPTTDRPREHAQSCDDLASQAIKEPSDEEHLQLTPEEAFFLVYGLGVLEISYRNSVISQPKLLPLFATHSVFPIKDAQRVAPDSPFLLKYVVYHHFRSLGWVVRPGIKFAVDYLLYYRGPVFAHAEFAVVILPAYLHPYWSETEERQRHSAEREHRDWWWLHRVNRVLTHALKTLVLVYVEVPPPVEKGEDADGEVNDVGQLLARYKVREFIFQRWQMNRQRN